MDTLRIESLVALSHRFRAGELSGEEYYLLMLDALIQIGELKDADIAMEELAAQLVK